MKKCFIYIVSGRVQGVWYRYGAQKAAKKIGITGWVKNEASGNVAIMACGTDENLKQFERWIHRGPILAKVRNINIKQVAYQEFDDFEIL